MADPKTPMDRQKKEAERRSALAEGQWMQVAMSGAATVTLSGRNGTTEVEALPYVDWSYDWRLALQSGDFGTFALAILDDENYAKWAQVRPSNTDVLDFMVAWGDATGEDLGESQAS